MTEHKVIILPNVSDDENKTLNILLEQLAAKQSRNFLRASYYDGKHAVRSIGSIIPPQFYKLGIVLGWSAKAVDTLARRCNLDDFVWADGDLESLGARDLWDANFLGTEVSSGLTSSLIHGTSFLVTTRGDESVGEPAALIHAKDAMNATGTWNTRARRLDNLLSITSRDDEGEPTSLALYLDNLTITAEKDGSTWTVDRSEHPWGVPAEPLVYKPRVGRPFGSSRISRPVMSLCDQALRTVIRMEAHNEVYTIPDLWLFGADASIFKNADGSQKASWQMVMGRIKGVPDDPEREGEANARADVKQFPASSPEPHILSLKQQAQLFSGETSIPLTSLGVSDTSNPTSADSYIASREDLIAEAEGATDDWSPALRRTEMRALAIANGLSEIPAAWSTIDTKFRSPVYLSRAAQADAGAKQLAVVPWLSETSVGLELLGLSDQQIRTAQAERQRANGRQILDRLTTPADGNPA
ncbi:MAG: portal protein [Marmoricola sp.]|nr:portal protein [Marmoricola sp.]